MCYRKTILFFEGLFSPLILHLGKDKTNMIIFQILEI